MNGRAKARAGASGTGSGPGIDPAPGIGPARQADARAASAERAVVTRHLRRVWGLPGTLLGVAASPATPAQRCFGPWNYWWQAHLLDCLVDAYLRAPTPARRARVEQAVAGIRLRNGHGWRNDYHDDMAWLALALDRAGRHVLGRGPRTTRAIADLSAALYAAWTEDAGGGIWWRAREKYREDFKNVPANGPAAILFARLREPRAYETAHWIERRLVDPATGLVWDGLHVSPHGGVREVETTPYTYNQGVFLGACLELAAWDHDGAEAELWSGRAVRTIEAVAAQLTVRMPGTERGGAASASAGTQLTARPSGTEHGAAPPASAGTQLTVRPFGTEGGGASPASARTNILRAQGGGDGGLFAGILARYLAQAALALPAFGPDYEPAARIAADLVHDSARAAWDHAAWGAPARRGVLPRIVSASPSASPPASTGPVFGHDWSTPARLPYHGGVAERDLSVQVGAWMLLEASALLRRADSGAPAAPGRGVARPRGRGGHLGRNLGRIQSLYSP